MINQSIDTIFLSCLFSSGLLLHVFQTTAISVLVSLLLRNSAVSTLTGAALSLLPMLASIFTEDLPIIIKGALHALAGISDYILEGELVFQELVLSLSFGFIISSLIIYLSILLLQKLEL
jgi:hypothetical protein